MRASARFLAAVSALGLSAAASAVTYNYSDTTFINANWNGNILADTSSPPASFAAGTTTSLPGGSMLLPGAQTADYRRISHTFGGGAGGAIVVSHQSIPWAWAPGAGETATTVDYSYDLNYIDGAPGGVGFSPAIFQSGNVYRLFTQDQIFGPNSGWQRFGSTSLPIASFFQVDPSTGFTLVGTPNPAAAMSFGFTSANSASGTATKVSGLDEFRVTLNTTVVPEPASLSAITAMAILGRRRRVQ